MAGVYYTAARGLAARLPRLAAAALAVALLGPAAVLAQDAAPKFGVNPTMARGPAGAPVTIYEFSDYQ